MLRLIDSPPADPNEDVALDAALFRALEAEGSPETLRFWECRRPAVIVGALAAISRQVHEQTCLADNVPVLRRISGGGAVIVGPGCLNYSLVLSLDARPELRQIERSYRLIMSRIAAALDIPGLSICGLGDLAIGELKIAGCAQRRGRRTLLHHGTVLYDFDLHWMERYLKEPERRPAYRAGRRHTAFVTNAPVGPEATTD
jgi:lipoate-protein ligase A